MQCKLQIDEEREKNIQCDGCKKLFHTLCCTELDKRNFKHRLENKDEEFFCHLCDDNDQTLKEELKEIKTKLIMLS